MACCKVRGGSVGLVPTDRGERGSVAMSLRLAYGGELFDQPVRLTRFKLVHAVWGRQRMEMLPA